MNRLRRAAALSAQDWRLLGGAWLTLAQVRIALSLRPWRRVTTRIDAAGRSHCTAQRVVWAVRVASRAIPRATCLTQALALHRLLAHYGHPSFVQVGASQVDNRFSAHAWVEHQGGSLLANPAEIAHYTRFFTWPHSEIERP